MARKIPPKALAYLQSLGKRFGSLGGKTAAKNMTAGERLARARKASDAAARKRRAERLARKRARRSAHR
jgi:hypothetical protein